MPNASPLASGSVAATVPTVVTTSPRSTLTVVGSLVGVAGWGVTLTEMASGTDSSVGAVVGKLGTSFTSVTVIVTSWVAVSADVALSLAVTVTV